MQAVFVAVCVLALAASANAQGYLESVTYLHDPSKFNTNYKPQVGTCIIIVKKLMLRCALVLEVIII